MKESKFKILVPTDFSEQSNLALHQAIHFAEITKSQVTLLYVLHEKKGILGNIFNKQQTQMFDDAIEEKLQEQSKQYREKHNLSIDYKLVHSTSIHSAILKHSIEGAFSIIIMGKGSIYENGVELPSIGSNTAKVVRHAKIPVITVGNSRHSTSIKSILLPLDLTKETRQKVGWGAKVAKIFGAEVILFSAIWGSNNTEVKLKIETQMKQAVSVLTKQGIKCKSAIIESKSDNNLTPIINRYIDKNPNLDLAIIMTQQENDFTEFFLGSSATEFIRSVNLPVLSVVPRELDQIVLGL
ncbi:MAG: hypothetical protein B6I18_01340 [Bacteroidetes bacterium 4572_112]|nr:MAG: hypothetical protein B6I18_01340 [Bacteroidetes bacterium 4572_112]